MANVNFYNQTPSDVQVASDLGKGELSVFKHLTSGAGQLYDQVEVLVALTFNMHHENTVADWEDEDYFVMVCSNFDYMGNRAKLRATAKNWFAAGCPNQVTKI